MKLQRDLLIIDFESFGEDLEKAQIVKISSIILDKDNLLLKNSKDWYIRHSWLASTTEQHARLLGVPPEAITSGLKPLETARECEKAFSGNLLLAIPNFQKLVGLRYFFRKQSLPFPFETACLDLYTAYQLFALKSGWRKSPSLTSLAEFFGKRLKSFHDPAERVRLHGEIFSKILSSL